jgi:hypothetical protein
MTSNAAPSPCAGQHACCAPNDRLDEHRLLRQAYNALMGEDHDDRLPGRSSIDDIIELYKKDVDRTLLREALKLTPDQRVRRLVELTRFTERLRQAEKKTTP